MLNVIELWRNIDRILSLDARHRQAIESLEAELQDLKSRVTRIEAREEIVVEKARAAAGAAAGAVTMESMSEMAYRIGRLEERSGQGRLAQPGATT